MTDKDAVIVGFDYESDKFERISTESLEKESHWVLGPSFLVIERSAGRLPGNSSAAAKARSEARVCPFLPLSAADIGRQKAAGKDVSRSQPHGPLPLTLKSRLVRRARIRGTFPSW